LYLQTAQALRSVSRCKVTLIPPMPDINMWTEADECFINPTSGHAGLSPPGQTSMMQEFMHMYSSSQPADAQRAACVHTSIPGGEDRMKMVFDDRAIVQSSDEHLAVVAER
jgi:hypothetical protein